MHHTIEPQTETSQAEPSRRFQCRHIFTDGHRCGSPCLRGEDLCFYHHTARKPAANPRTRADTSNARRSSFSLPLPDPNDRSGIQLAIGEVLQRIAADDIDPRRAGLLLYGLQIASLNLPKPQREASPESTVTETVEEITLHPELGTLAPRAEVGQATQRKSAVALLIDKLIEDAKQRQQNHPQPATLPTLQAAYDPLVAVLRPCSHPDPEPVEGEGSRRDRSRLRRFSISAEDANGPMPHPLPHPFDRNLSLAEGPLKKSSRPAETLEALNPCNSPTPVVALSSACRAATHLRSLPSAIGATQRPAESSHASLKPPRHFRVFELPEPQPKKVAALSFSRTISKERP